MSVSQEVPNPPRVHPKSTWHVMWRHGGEYLQKKPLNFFIFSYLVISLSPHQSLSLSPRPPLPATLRANVSTPLSTSELLLLPDESAASLAAAASSEFESSESFAAVPLQPVPRFPSGPICAPAGGGFLSKPIERGFLSGPLDAALMSRPLSGAATSGGMGGTMPMLHQSLSVTACNANFGGLQ